MIIPLFFIYNIILWLLKQLATVGESLDAFRKVNDVLNSNIKGADAQRKIVDNLKEATKNCSTEALKMALSQEELWKGTNKLDQELVKEILSQHILDKELLEYIKERRIAGEKVIGLSDDLRIQVGKM